MDQGLGIGTKAPLFNRCTAQLTRFWQLRKPGPKSKNPPVALVLHGRAGNVIGDLPVYDAFQLGGPHSGARRAHAGDTLGMLRAGHTLGTRWAAGSRAAVAGRCGLAASGFF